MPSHPFNHSNPCLPSSCSAEAVDAILSHKKAVEVSLVGITGAGERAVRRAFEEEDSRMQREVGAHIRYLDGQREDLRARANVLLVTLQRLTEEKAAMVSVVHERATLF